VAKPPSRWLGVEVARQLTEWPDGPPVRGNYPAYPWSDWMNGEIWELTADDVFGALVGFQSGLYTRAKNDGFKVRTSHKDGVLRFQFYLAD
jgi:hypothetical protein